MLTVLFLLAFLLPTQPRMVRPIIVAPPPANAYVWCDGTLHATPQPAGMPCYRVRRHFPAPGR